MDTESRQEKTEETEKSESGDMVKFVECNWVRGLNNVDKDLVDYFQGLRKEMNLSSTEHPSDVPRYDPLLVRTIEHFDPPNVFVTKVPRKYAPFIEVHGSSDTEYTILHFGDYQVDKIKALLANKKDMPLQSLVDEIEQVINEPLIDYY